MRFTELLREITATYREQPRAFHVLATRFYLGAETVQSLREHATTTRPVMDKYGETYTMAATLTKPQVAAIIANR